MRIDVLTLFPNMFESPMSESMMWKAKETGLLDLHLHDIRDYSQDKHRTVDDTPYGGGGGMLLRVDVMVRAIESVVAMDTHSPSPPVILMTPQGRLFSHHVARELAGHPRLVIVCSHYEGEDERVRQLAITDEISIGDYVLTGGELAAMVVIDATLRHVGGLLGAEGAELRDSHADGLLEGAHYTRPPVFRGLEVPQVLQTGNHAQIQAWRREQALRRTWERRRDLLRKAKLTEAEKYLLAKFAREDAQRLK